jgi:hypothetical protein
MKNKNPLSQRKISLVTGTYVKWTEIKLSFDTSEIEKNAKGSVCSKDELPVPLLHNIADQ